MRTIRERAGEAATASANRSAPQPSPPTTTSATSGQPAASGPEGRDQQRVVLARLDGADGQHVPAAPSGSGRAGAVGRSSGAGSRGTPWWTARTRSGSMPSSATTSSATNRRRGVHPGPVRDGAPDSVGRRGWARRTARGSRTTVRSWTVTTRAARPVGGTTKLVPWTTSLAPEEPLDRRHGYRAARPSAAGGPASAAVARPTPAGHDRRSLAGGASSPRTRHVTRSRRPARPRERPAQNTPTPVGRPSSGVASNPTDSRSGAAVAGRSGGTA